jgi:hypothetical protein
MTTQPIDLVSRYRPASKPRLIPFSTYAHHHPRRTWRRPGRGALQRRAQLRQALLAAMVEAGS